jgi:hypothetical protein
MHSYVAIQSMQMDAVDQMQPCRRVQSGSIVVSYAAHDAVDALLCRNSVDADGCSRSDAAMQAGTVG